VFNHLNPETPLSFPPLTRARWRTYDFAMDTPFRMGRLDHVHLRVPNRAEAAAWYAEHLGFEPVERFDFWARGFEGGPLQISADGGRTMLALFEASDGHPMIANDTGVAFSVEPETFVQFAVSLPRGLPGRDGQPLQPNDLVDFDMCWAYEFTDPWGNRFELNCYDYDRIRVELVERHGIAPARMWPAELFEEWTGP
jgi:catechol 2,3-dioxygenase-like lactoylglutathione lyase family enzyme